MILTIVYIAGFIGCFIALNILGLQWARDDAGHELDTIERLEVYVLSAVMSLFWPVLITMMSFKVVNRYMDGAHG